ncbi:membrane protein [Oceanicola sp. 22II-s10i]|uniref:TolC family protein n=1 Tax=Oceanicola sp. 22II-s10i TaxID=1317116 RepID=UPI000B526403|nr:TolC family protein [Oceanicola sp. 22II-s10i]OWU80807.1 membrane protein [Oceanicola sp. 22II-s10i]
MIRADLAVLPRAAVRVARRCLSGAAVALLLSAVSAGAQVALSDAARLATELDPNVTAMRQQVASRTIGIQQARDEYFPSLSVSADSGTTDADGPGLTLTVSQVLYDWGLIRSKIKTATQARVQAVADLKMSVEDLTLQLSEAFLDIEVTERKLRLTRDYAAYAGRLARQAEDRARAGLGDNGEVARARLEIARARDRLQTLESDLAMSLAQIEFLIGRPVPGVLPPPSLDFAGRYSGEGKILSAVRVAPDYIAGRAAATEAEANVERVKASRLPTIKLQAQGRADLNGGRTRTAIGISAGVDLNASTLGGRGVQMAERELEAARSSLRAIERQMGNVARTSLRHIASLRATEQARFVQLEQARRVLDNYEKQFVAGQRDLIDVLTTGRDLYDAQIDQVDTYDERKRTEYQAARDLGVLGTLILAAS